MDLEEKEGDAISEEENEGEMERKYGRWEELNCETKPSERFFCSLTTLDDKRVLLYGGKHKEKALNCVYIFHTERNEWEKLELRDAPYSFAHSATFYKGSVFFFGGADINDLCTSKMWRFDVREKQLFAVADAKRDIPSPRRGHGHVLLEGKLFIFGGFDGNKRFNDLHCFHFESLTWECLSPNKENFNPIILPEVRSYPGFWTEGENLFLFGGRGSRIGFLRDLWMFRLSDKKWIRILQEGDSPPQRYCPSVIYEADKGSTLFIFSTNFFL